MNTSTRILKVNEPVDLVPLPIPTIGEHPRSRPGTEPFIVAALDPGALQPVQAIQLDHEVSPDNLLETAHREASKIIAQAEESRSLIEQAALEKAQIDAMAAVEEEVSARVSTFRERLVETIEKLSNLSAEIVSHAESDLVELALQIAKKIVRREVTIDREIALTLVRISLAKLNQRTAVQIHLNPEDLSHIQKHLNDLDFRGTVELKEDLSIEPGGCLIQTETGDIDGRIESQFDEIAFGLLT